MKNKKGILLFEVIMAVALLAIGLTMISRSFTSCIRVLETAQDYSTATFLAEQVLWGLETKKSDDWESDGEFEDNPRFTWHQDNEEVEDLGQLRDVRLNINWKRRNRDYKLRISTFMPDEET